MIRRLSLFLALLASAGAATPDATSIVAERSQTDLRTGETILTGHPHVDYGDVRLTADEIRIHPQTRVATANGHAVLTQGPRRLLADMITYNAATGAFQVGRLRFGVFPVYISGASASGTLQSVVIDDARLTVPEPGGLIPTLHAARLFFNGNRQIRAEQASLGLGDVRPLALHGYEHDVRQPLVPFVSLTGGYRRNLGVFAEAGLHLPLFPNFRVGGDLSVYSSRGVMAGPAGDYAGATPSGSYAGTFRSGFISDYGTRYTDILGRAVPRERGFAEWHHRQDLTDRFAVTGEFNYWTDSEVLRDFRQTDFYRVQQPDNFVESVYAGNNYFVSLFARFAPNDFQAVQERLPELRFDLLPTAVGGGFYERFNASAVVLREQDPILPDLGPGFVDLRSRTNRLDAYYSLSRPFAYRDWLTFTPVAGARVTNYSSSDRSATFETPAPSPFSDPVPIITGYERYTRALGELGFDAELHSSATWDYKNPRWKIDGLRHLLTPRLSYRYIPEAEKGARYFPAIDRRSFSTYLPPLGLGDQRNLDDLHATNTLRLGLDNTLQTRDPVYGSRDLVVFNVANDLRFKRGPGERDVSAIHTELAVLPARWLELGVYQSFTPQDFTLQEFNTGVTLRDGDEWTARFASNFLRGELNDYFLESTRRFNEVFAGVLHLRYDARQRRFNEQAYGIRQNIGNNWSVEYIVTLYDGPRRESRFGFNVRIDAIRF